MKPDQKEAAAKFKNTLSTYNDAEDLINIGAYKRGSNPGIDDSIDKIGKILDYIKQDTAKRFEFEEEVSMLKAIFEDSGQEYR